MIRLTATLIERGSIRFSPAGVPVLDCRLVHRSVQPEAGIDRQVEFEIGAVVLGALVEQLDAIRPGADVTVEGFLAPSRKSSKSLVLHITCFCTSPESIAADPS